MSSWPPGLDQMPGVTSDDSFSIRLRNAFDSGSYSDLTVICKQRKWKVHRMQLVQHSPVFEAMVKGLSKGEATLELKDDDPDAVNHMLRYMYHFCYNFSRERTTIVENMRVHKVANKYQIPGLAKEAWFRYGISMVVMPLAEFITGVKEAYGADGYDEFRKSFVRRIALVTEEKRSKPDVHKKFWEMLEDLPELAMDLLRSNELVDMSSLCRPCKQRKQLSVDSSDGKDAKNKAVTYDSPDEGNSSVYED